MVLVAGKLQSSESFLANELKIRFVLASGKHKGNAFNDHKLYVLIVSIRYLMPT